MPFRRSKHPKSTPELPRNPGNCGLQTFQTKKEVSEVTETQMVMITRSSAYRNARNNHEQYPDVSIERWYATEGGEYTPEEVTVQKTKYLGVLTCRQMEKKGIDPVTAEGSTAENAFAQVGRTVAELYCRTCPYFGKDSLQAARYDAQVAGAEREAADQILAAEQARREVANMNRHLELPPTES